MNAVRGFIAWIKTHRVLTVVVVAGLGGGVWYGVRRQRSAQDVLSEPLQKGRVVQTVYGIGTVKARHVFELKIGMIGTIERLDVEDGARVVKGQILGKIEGVTYRAPFAGVVTNVAFRLGENIPPNAVILAVTDPTDRYVSVALEQQSALRVREGQSAKLSFDTIRQANYDGVVKFVYSSGSDFFARIEIARLAAEILPGMTADVAIVIDEHADALLAPVAALEGGGTLWVKNSEHDAKATSVGIGFVDRAMVEIVKGEVRPGDQVVIRRYLTP